MVSGEEEKGGGGKRAGKYERKQERKGETHEATPCRNGGRFKRGKSQKEREKGRNGAAIAGRRRVGRRELGNGGRGAATSH